MSLAVSDTKLVIKRAKKKKLIITNEYYGENWLVSTAFAVTHIHVKQQQQQTKPNTNHQLRSIRLPMIRIFIANREHGLRRRRKRGKVGHHKSTKCFVQFSFWMKKKKNVWKAIISRTTKRPTPIHNRHSTNPPPHTQTHIAKSKSF